MTSHFTRMALTAAFFVLSTAAGLAAVSTEPVEPTGIDSGLGPIRIDDDRQQPAASEIPSGNPLWAIPLKELSATRERPIFSPSRRAPAPADALYTAAAGKAAGTRASTALACWHHCRGWRKLRHLSRSLGQYGAQAEDGGGA
jgi:hypothetical protein